VQQSMIVNILLAQSWEAVLNKALRAVHGFSERVRALGILYQEI